MPRRRCRPGCRGAIKKADVGGVILARDSFVAEVDQKHHGRNRQGLAQAAARPDRGPAAICTATEMRCIIKGMLMYQGLVFLLSKGLDKVESTSAVTVT